MKNLPIKIFEQRRQDNVKPEAGRGDKPPKWVISNADLLAARASALNGSLDQVADEMQRRKYGLPATIAVSIIGDALAKTHRESISELFSVKQKSNVIGFEGYDKLVVKIDTLDDLSRVQEKIQNYSYNNVAISAISQLELFRPVLKVEAGDQKRALKVRLIDYHSADLNSRASRVFRQFCDTNGVELKETAYTNSFTVFRVDNPSQGDVAILQNFESVYSIEFMPSYSVSFDELGEGEVIEVKKPIEGIDYPVVGVLDSGIAEIPHLAPWVSQRYTCVPEDLEDRGHGTFVAGILVYADALQGQEHVGVDGVRLLDAAIMPDRRKETVYEDDLVQRVRDVMEEYADKVKVWQMSISIDREVENDAFSELGVVLDELQKEYGVLICKSAGNCRNFLSELPVGRISSSADSVRSLVVGSIAHEKGVNDLVGVGEPSPFSRRGPAPAGLIKPDVSHFGGNAGTKSGRLTYSGVRSFDTRGNIISNIGTSFSTPRVAALVAGLTSALAEPFKAEFYKALVIHSSEHPAIANLRSDEKVNSMGYGVPPMISEIIYNDPYEATLILQDTLGKSQYIDIMDLPFPDMFDEDAYFRGEIKVTLVSSPVLDRTQGIEYCQSDIKVMMGTYDEKVYKADGVKMNNPVKRKGSKNVLNHGLYSNKAFVSSVNVPRERLLINHKGKFQPVKKFVVNLQEMTMTNKEKALASKRKWYLRLESLYRYFAEKNYIGDCTQDFCLIVTIKDPLKQVQVYDQVTQKLNANNFVQRSIAIKQNVRVRT